MTIVFVALPFERRALLRACRHGIARDDVGRILSWCVGANHRVVECGLGLAAAARGVDAIMHVVRPTALLSVGCAGGLDPSLVPGDLVLADNVVDAGEPSKGFERGLDEMATRLGERGLSVRRGRIASVSNIVATPSEKERLFARTRALVVDMESASIAGAASTAGIPFCGIRIVLDDARTEVPACIEDERFRLLPFTLVAERLEAVGAALFGGNKTDFRGL